MMLPRLRVRCGSGPGVAWRRVWRGGILQTLSCAEELGSRVDSAGRGARHGGATAGATEAAASARALAGHIGDGDSGSRFDTSDSECMIALHVQALLCCQISRQAPVVDPLCSSRQRRRRQRDRDRLQLASAVID